ncbi:hypothetical protein GCM10009347_36880 [Shewanella algicola]|nr:hypothetical protein GCM10009347_36880 [Shewanella algicola]
MLFGKFILLFGSLLLWPSVIFGLGLLGVIPDELTSFTGNIKMSQLITGVSLAISIILLVDGYVMIKDNQSCEEFE